MTTIIDKPKVEIDPDVLKALKAVPQTEGQVILHFTLSTLPTSELLIRIWPTSYLFDQGSTHISELVHYENITLYPEWYICSAGSNVHFTLIFSKLPAECTHFDFIEQCQSEYGAFKVLNIERNETDVYYLRM